MRANSVQAMVPQPPFQSGSQLAGQRRRGVHQKVGKTAAAREQSLKGVFRNQNLALKDTGLSPKNMSRSTNMFALGLLYWLYGRSMDSSIDFIQKKFATKPEIVDANIKALNAGYYYGENTEAFQQRVRVPQRLTLEPGVYRRISGNDALVLGLVTASKKADTPLFYGSYPITPASPIRLLSRWRLQGSVRL